VSYCTTCNRDVSCVNVHHDGGTCCACSSVPLPPCEGCEPDPWINVDQVGNWNDMTSEQRRAFMAGVREG
jgi:hypothetical protein